MKIYLYMRAENVHACLDKGLKFQKLLWDKAFLAGSQFFYLTFTFVQIIYITMAHVQQKKHSIS